MWLAPLLVPVLPCRCCKRLRLAPEQTMSQPTCQEQAPVQLQLACWPSLVLLWMLQLPALVLMLLCLRCPSLVLPWMLQLPALVLVLLCLRCPSRLCQALWQHLVRVQVRCWRWGRQPAGAAAPGWHAA
jgi:hypothetical protein